MKQKTKLKQTEIGKIPEDWEVKKLGNFTDIKTGKKNGNEEVDDGKYPFFVRSQKIKRIDTYSFDGEAILIPGEGGIGTIIHYINGKFDYHQRVYKISNFGKDNSAKFIYYSMIQNFDKHATKNSVKATVDSLRLPTFLEFEFPAPKFLKEQTLIAQVLSETDELIQQLDKLITKKKNIKKGAMQELLTGKKRLPGFSSEWEEKKLGDILFYEQPVKYIVKNTKYKNSYQVPVLTANKAFILGYTNESEGIFQNIPAIIFDDFTLDNKYVRFPFKVKSSAIKILKIKDGKSDLRFIFGLMQLIKFPIGDHKRYYISEYQNIEITVPTIKEQTAIANILSDMDLEIESLQRKRDKYKMIKEGMMQQLLTGKIRLNTEKWERV